MEECKQFLETPTVHLSYTKSINGSIITAVGGLITLIGKEITTVGMLITNLHNFYTTLHKTVVKGLIEDGLDG